MCEARHPTTGAQCEAPEAETDKYHLTHYAGSGPDAYWPNPGAEPVPLPQPRKKLSETREKAKAVKKAVEVERDRVAAAEKTQAPTVLTRGPHGLVTKEALVGPHDQDREAAIAEGRRGMSRAYEAATVHWRWEATRAGFAVACAPPLSDLFPFGHYISDSFWFPPGYPPLPPSIRRDGRHENRSLGHVVKWLGERGYAEKTNMVVPTAQRKSHGSPATIWRSLVVGRSVQELLRAEGLAVEPPLPELEPEPEHHSGLPLDLANTLRDF